jgi:small-conductance mechanosensitive channel
MMGNKYIYNKHIAPVTCNARSRKGEVLFSVKFEPERADGTTGRVISTGYTTLTDEQYEQLCDSSRTFVHYKDDLKLLIECDDLPASAKTPHEALADARKQALEAGSKVAELEAENVKLKAELHDAEEKLGQLVSASTPEEALEPLKDAIASLTEANDTLKADIGALVAERDDLKARLADAEKKQKKEKGKEFD